ncbi:MAG TPA: Dickkopf N-terminal cysteine-rich domain-containing protein, partial [Fredinandcohnia sp.]|nr:Dickkopf N-terminal cysteine-rich domain-containing protein [Fredinandcohnia sp.]
MNARNRILYLAAAIGLLVLGTGCSPKYPNCNSDDDCNVDGHTGVCINGLCQECGSDKDCPSGFKCEIDTAGGNRCVPKAECQTNRDCSGGRVCENGSCVACSSDAQCGHGAECVNGACRPKAECSIDADCGSGKSCVEGTCVTTAPPCEQPPVRFAFDDYSLTAEAREALQKLAECLRQHPVNVTL